MRVGFCGRALAERAPATRDAAVRYPPTASSRRGRVRARWACRSFREGETEQQSPPPRIEVAVSFRNLMTFWLSQTPRSAPITKVIAAMSPRDRQALIEAVEADLRPLPGGIGVLCPGQRRQRALSSRTELTGRGQGGGLLMAQGRSLRRRSEFCLLFVELLPCRRGDRHASS